MQTLQAWCRGHQGPVVQDAECAAAAVIVKVAYLGKGVPCMLGLILETWTRHPVGLWSPPSSAQPPCSGNEFCLFTRLCNSEVFDWQGVCWFFKCAEENTDSVCWSYSAWSGTFVHRANLLFGVRTSIYDLAVVFANCMISRRWWSALRLLQLLWWFNFRDSGGGGDFVAYHPWRQVGLLWTGEILTSLAVLNQCLWPCKAWVVGEDVMLHPISTFVFKQW